VWNRIPDDVREIVQLALDEPELSPSPHGVELERSTLAGWVGGARWWLEALHDRLGKTCSPPIICSPTIRRSRTSIRAPGRTKTGRPDGALDGISSKK
jgi:hypothetical protein